MAVIKSIFTKIIITIITVQCVFCLYEDQIGKFDWKKIHIGKLKYASFDSVKRIIIATEENVIASLHLKNGQVAWRHVLEEPLHQIDLLHVDDDVLTISGNGNTYYVRGWDLNSGMLLYEWSLTTEKTNSRWIVTKNNIFHIIPVTNSHLEVTEYQIKTGLNKGVTSKVSTAWITDLKNCVIAGTSWVCITGNDSSGKIYSIDLMGDMSKVHMKSLNLLIGDANGVVTIEEFKHATPAIILCRNNIKRVVLLEEATTILPYSLESNFISVFNGDQTELMQFEYVHDKSETSIQLKTINIQTEENQIIPLEPQHSSHGPTLITGVCRGTNCRVLFTTHDNAIHLLQLPSGKVQWTREEALSEVVAADFVELPLSELDASIEREFNEASNDIISMFLRRLISQFRQLSTFITGQQTSTNNVLVRDDFGLHKLIILATKVGKLFAIDTLTGEIVWTKFLANLAPFTVLDKDVLLLYQQRTARYAPLVAAMTLVGKDRNSNECVIFKFDPITGNSLTGVNTFNFKIKQAMLMPFEDKDHVKGLVILAENNELHVFPETTKSILKEHANFMFMYSTDSDQSSLNGYAIMNTGDENIKATKTWTLDLSGSKIVSLSMRPHNERVHSQGRVLADRSVFYKYVNPNLIALATISDDIMHKHVLSLYLVDGVTGLIVYSAHHKRATGPVQMVHSENWIVYSYFSERFRRIEITAVELYEGARQSNSTAFSSHALSQLPHPETLSYIFSGTPLAMKATLTDRGITNKHILIALSNGAVVEMPWAFIEPRGPHLPSNPEEGYIPYIPELPIHSESVVNYNQSLARIKGIQVSPARLESTCLVVIYGLDLFYTRVTPSKTFDVLKEDFDHWLIVMVLVALILASYASKRLSMRKALKQVWK